MSESKSYVEGWEGEECLTGKTDVSHDMVTLCRRHNNAQANCTEELLLCYIKCEEG